MVVSRLRRLFSFVATAISWVLPQRLGAVYRRASALPTTVMRRMSTALLKRSVVGSTESLVTRQHSIAQAKKSIAGVEKAPHVSRRDSGCVYLPAAAPKVASTVGRDWKVLSVKVAADPVFGLGLILDSDTHDVAEVSDLGGVVKFGSDVRSGDRILSIRVNTEVAAEDPAELELTPDQHLGVLLQSPSLAAGFELGWILKITRGPNAPPPRGASPKEAVAVMAGTL